MILQVLVCLVFTGFIIQLDASPMLFDFLSSCGNVTESYHHSLLQDDPVSVQIHIDDWTDPNILSCSMIFRADNIDKRLSYEFSRFSVQDMGTSLKLETKGSTNYTTEGTYNMLNSPSIGVEVKADTYLKLTFKRTSTNGSRAEIDVKINNKGGFRFSTGSIVGMLAGIGVVVVIVSVGLCHKARMRGSGRRVCMQNGATVTTTARRPPGVHGVPPFGQNPMSINPGFPHTETTPHYQTLANSQGYQPIMVAQRCPQLVNHPPGDAQGFSFTSGVSESIPETPPPEYQLYPNGYQLQTDGSGNASYSNAPPPSYDQVTKEQP